MGGDHRGHDPEKYEDTRVPGPRGKKRCPLCPKRVRDLPTHLENDHE